MAFFPWSSRSGGQFTGTTPLGGFLDRAASAFCGAYLPIAQWVDSVYRAAGIPGGAAAFLSSYSATASICATQPPPPITVPGLPSFPENCATFGSVIGKVNVAGDGQPPLWLPSETFWSCSQDIGRPVGGWQWLQITPSIWGWRLLMERPSGNPPTFIDGPQTSFGDVRSRTQIQSVDIQYCPSCSLPPRQPVPPVIEPPGAPPDPDNPPIIPIDIDFPTQPGLPPISFPVEFSPRINLEFSPNIQPIITLSPRIDLNPSFDFAPNIEFNAGGISIYGGGWPLPQIRVPDVLDCDCPDPCPPGGDVDYARIQESVKQLLLTRWRFPGELGPIVGGWIEFRQAWNVSLAASVVAVEYEIDDTGYTGGGTPVVDGVPGIGYYGWYRLTAVNGLTIGPDRRFISSVNGVIETPGQTAAIAINATDGLRVRLRTYQMREIPPP